MCVCEDVAGRREGALQGQDDVGVLKQIRGLKASATTTPLGRMVFCCGCVCVYISRGGSIDALCDVDALRTLGVGIWTYNW